MKSEDIYLLEDTRARRTEEAIKKAREIIERDKKFKKYLEYYLNRDRLNDLFEALWRKNDFRKIQKINKLFNIIYIANFTDSGLKRDDCAVKISDKDQVTRECFDEINDIMNKENVEPYDPLWMAH